MLVDWVEYNFLHWWTWTWTASVLGWKSSVRFQQGMRCSALLFSFFVFSCCLIRCTYAKKMNTSALFTINISISFRLSAERNRRLSFQHSSNREMIYRKSVLTLQMLHFIWSVYQSLCRMKSERTCFSWTYVYMHTRTYSLYSDPI